jgi:hypothetical protein
MPHGPAVPLTGKTLFAAKGGQTDIAFKLSGKPMAMMLTVAWAFPATEDAAQSPIVGDLLSFVHVVVLGRTAATGGIQLIVLKEGSGMRFLSTARRFNFDRPSLDSMNPILIRRPEMGVFWLLRRWLLRPRTAHCSISVGTRLNAGRSKSGD